MYVSSYYYTTCVLILLYMCPCNTRCVLILLHNMCKHLTSDCDMCVLVMLYVCPHTTTYVSSYYYICVLVLLRVSSYSYTTSASTLRLHVSSYYYICVLALLYVSSLVLLHVCPHTPTTRMSSYSYTTGRPDSQEKKKQADAQPDGGGGVSRSGGGAAVAQTPVPQKAPNASLYTYTPSETLPYAVRSSSPQTTGSTNTSSKNTSSKNTSSKDTSSGKASAAAQGTPRKRPSASVLAANGNPPEGVISGASGVSGSAGKAGGAMGGEWMFKGFQMIDFAGTNAQILTRY